MKKLYTIILAACTIFAASAAQPEVLTEALTATQQTETALKTKVKHPKAAGFNLGEAAVRGQQRIGVDKTATDEYTWVSVGTGQYISSVLAEFYSSSTKPVDVEIFEANEKPGVYKAVGVWPDMVKNGELIVDASDPSFIKVKKQFTGLVDKVDGDTYIASMTWVLTEEEGYSASIVAQALPEILPTYKNGCITFPFLSLALKWPDAPEDSKYQTDPNEWYPNEEIEGALILPGGEYTDPWMYLGEGTVSGDMYYSVCGLTTFTDYNVAVYQYASNENTYRIADPLKGVYEALSFDGESPAWKLDTTDPDNIILIPNETGIGTSTEGAYIATTANMAHEEVQGPFPAELKASLTKDNNTLTFKFPKSSLLVLKAKAMTIEPANTTDVSITVKLSETGIESVEAADSNAPVEYFNLQGVRVANPTAGRLMIKRQGSKTTKVIVK